MPDSFDKFWATISDARYEGDTVRNWGLARGYTGGSFAITATARTWIAVSAKNTKGERRISQGEFAKIYAIWPDYCAGRIKRGELRDLSQNTTYILSIMNMILNKDKTVGS